MFADKKELLHFWVTLGVVALLGLLTFLLGADMSRLANKIQQAREEHAGRVAAVSAFATLQSDAIRARPYSNALENILPTKDNLIEFPKEMKELGRRNGIDVAITFGAEAQSSGKSPGSIRFAMTADGSYDGIVAWMSAVEHSRYIVGWNSVDVVEQKGRYHASIDGRVFSR